MSFFESFKSLVIITVIFFGLLKLFVFSMQQDFAFSISRNHLQYHSNWTSSFDKLRHLKEFHEALKLPSIQSIDVSFSMSQGLGFSDIVKILPSQLKPYKVVKLNLGSISLGTHGAQYVMSLIPNGVEQLELAFDSISADDNLGKSIATKLSELTSLKRVKISLILSSMKDQGFINFFANHKINPKLKNLRLVFIGNHLNGTVFQNFTNYLKNSELESFGMNLYANNIGAQGAKYIAQGLEGNRFKNLDIDLYFNNITEVGTKHLTDKISEFQTLKRLALNFDFNFIKNEGAKQIGSMLKKLPLLDELQIGVASKNFGYLGFKSLIDGMGHQTNLHHLSLRCGVNRVGINGAGIVNKMLEKMTKLQILNLGFVENYIGDEGIAEIAQTVATKLPHIKQASLDLGFNDAKGYGAIAALKHLATRSWQFLNLRLSNNQFRDSQIKLMKPHLKDLLNSAKIFIFEFMQTAVSRVMVKDLQNFFEKNGNENTKLHINSIIPENQQVQAEKKAQAQKSSQKNQGKTNNQKQKEQKQQKQKQNQGKKEKTTEKKQQQKKAKQEIKLERNSQDKAVKQQAARVEAERVAQQAARVEAERVAQQAARVEAERVAQQAARVEAERVAQQAARVEAARVEAERVAQQAARVEAERVAQQAARVEAERVAQQAARVEAERIQAERVAQQAARVEAERIQAERVAQQAARVEAERIQAERVAQQAARVEAERIQAERVAQQAARVEAERVAQQAARVEAERVAQQAARVEAERIQAERVAQQAARVEAERVAQQAARVEAERIEAQRIAQQAARVQVQNTEVKANQIKTEQL